MTSPTFTAVYLFVRDMAATVAFYRRLGFSIASADEHFVRVEVANGLSIEFGTAALTRGYDPNWREPSGPATNTLNLHARFP